jgi:hypothetical protein
MIEYFQFAVLIYLLYRVNCLINKVNKYAVFEVDVYLNIVPMQDDWKPVYNTSTTLKKSLKLSAPPIIDAVIADAGNCPARVYQIKQLENYLSCNARCEVEQESYENCIALYKESGWL